jgi:O-methyltransferase domain/Dimerisation domain
MNPNVGLVADLVFGRWRSQVLYAGVELGVFDHLDLNAPKTSPALAREVRADPTLLYRLLRALASIGLLRETGGREFTLSAAGALLRADHPQSMKAMTRLEEGPQHYALWKHLPAMVRDGKQNAFMREFGRMAFDHAKVDRDYDERFKQAMSSYSALQANLVLEVMRGLDLSAVRTFCDVAGGHGYLMAALLRAYPHISGIVLDLPEVVGDQAALMASDFGVEDRCRYVGGDMFKDVPRAEAYVLKMIVHDWNDAECIDILSCIRRSAPQGARAFVAEHVVPGHDEPHFGKLFDIHMMCWGTGRERTEAEYIRLLEGAGWKYVGCHYPAGRMMGVIEGAL